MAYTECICTQSYIHINEPYNCFWLFYLLHLCVRNIKLWTIQVLSSINKVRLPSKYGMGFAEREKSYSTDHLIILLQPLISILNGLQRYTTETKPLQRLITQIIHKSSSIHLHWDPNGYPIESKLLVQILFVSPICGRKYIFFEIIHHYY
jgi:hypothetical protein